MSYGIDLLYVLNMPMLTMSAFQQSECLTILNAELVREKGRKLNAKKVTKAQIGLKRGWNIDTSSLPSMTLLLALILILAISYALIELMVSMRAPSRDFYNSNSFMYTAKFS